MQITKAHRAVIRVLARLYRETQRHDFGLDFLASRCRLCTDAVHARCLELRDMGVVSMNEPPLIKIEPDMLPAVLAVR